MPIGLINANCAIVGISLLVAWVTGEASLLLIGLAIAVVFNVAVGATNSPKNTDSKFRRWLFGEK